MTFLLDTNVLSEPTRPKPEPRVLAWLASADEDRLYLSVLTLGEIRRGIDMLPDGSRRRRLEDWLAEDLPRRFEGRVLDIDRRVADRWGALIARGLRQGTPASTFDTFLAATALVHNLTLVTRNVRHVQVLGVPLLNPWL